MSRLRVTGGDEPGSGGGALLLGGASITLTDTRFIDNAMTDGVSGVGGGAIAAIGGDRLLRRSAAMTDVRHGRPIVPSPSLN